MDDPAITTENGAVINVISTKTTSGSFMGMSFDEMSLPDFDSTFGA